MPDWFAKTREMIAADKYFSLADAKTPDELVRRYTAALDRLANERTGFGRRSDALDAHMAPRRAAASLSGHFRGDWVHPLYYVDRDRYGHLGGLFWPTVASTTVVDGIRDGTEMAIHKALGDDELGKLGLTQEYRDALWQPERENDVDINGVLPLAMSWNCVAPKGSSYFDVAALRGPSVVEFAIATPEPNGVSATMRLRAHVTNQQIRVRPEDQLLLPPGDTEA